MDKCTFCGSDEEPLISATAGDASGGGALLICKDCSDRAQQERCCLCGNRMIGLQKANSIYVHDEKSDIEYLGSYCDTCRGSMFENPMGGVIGGFSVGNLSHRMGEDKEEMKKEEFEYQDSCNGKRSYER